MSSGIHRKRLACVECTRRKVKCDKILPCRNCTRKGTRCTRPRERDSPNPSALNQSDDQRERHNPVGPGADTSHIIESLQSRVNQLESALRDATEKTTRAHIPRTDIQKDSATLCSAESIAGDRSPITVQNSTRVDLGDTPREMEDAATILEFLAWGRRKEPSYQDKIARRGNLDHSPGDVHTESEWEDMNVPRPSAGALCQALLPSKTKVYALAKYHCECLLWYHGAFHAVNFLQELDHFYDRNNSQLGVNGVNLQWLSLLFSVLTGSMACMPGGIAQSFGFQAREQECLSKRWLKAAISCLHHGDYMADHSIYSVEAIATLTMSAHMLGHSNGFSVLLASAVRIAQGLGLHQLDDDDDDDDDYDDDDNDSDDISKDNLVKVEIGRRVWCQLCIQDWFSIPFTESYLIHRPCFTAAKPHNYDDDMNPVSEDFPTVTSYSRLFYDIAALMPELQNDVASCNTLYTRYEEVLKYDRQLRTLATKHLPYYLQNVPIEVTWPCYVPWARRSLAISSAHKVIMIHRKFLSLSFVNPMFEFTRKTCVAASRTIIKEQKEATRDGGPILWIHQAFSVTASIILCLDMFHQSVSDRQSSEHRQLIQDGIDILSRCQTDMIAQRGVALLRAMLDAEQKVSRDKQCPSELKPPQRIQENMPRGNGIDIATIIQTFYRHDRANVTRSSRLALQVPSTIRAAENGNWTEMTTDLPSLASSVDFITPLGVDYAEGLDDILSLATNYLS